MENVTILSAINSEHNFSNTFFVFSQNIDAEKILNSIKTAPAALKDINNSDVLFVVAKSAEVAEFSKLIAPACALKILITDEKVDACAKFDAFILNLNDAEKIISNVNLILNSPTLDFTDIQYIFKNTGETVILSGEGSNAVEDLKNKITVDKNLHSAKFVFMRFKNSDTDNAREIYNELEKQMPPDSDIMIDVDYDSTNDTPPIFLLLTQFNRSKNFVFTVAKSSDIAAFSDAIKNSPAAVKILVTDKKVDACKDFDAFILDFDNAGKIIDSIKALTAPAATFYLDETKTTAKFEIAADYFEIEYAFKNSGEVTNLSGEGFNALEALKNALDTNKNLSSAKAAVLSIFYPLKFDFDFMEVAEVEFELRKNLNSNAQIASEIRHYRNICNIVKVNIFVTKF